MMLRELFDRMATTDAPLDIDAVLFRCVEQELGATDDLGGGAIWARLRIVPIAGDHYSLKDPANIPSLCVSFIAAMAQHLSRSLSRSAIQHLPGGRASR